MQARKLALVGLIGAVLLVAPVLRHDLSSAQSTDLGFKAGPRIPASPSLTSAAAAVPDTGDSVSTSEQSAQDQSSDSPSVPSESLTTAGSAPADATNAEAPQAVVANSEEPAPLPAPSAATIPSAPTEAESPTSPPQPVAAVAAKPAAAVFAAPSPAAPVAVAPAPAVPQVSSYSVSLNGYENRLFVSHNSVRQQSGLGALQIDGTLTEIARQRASDMAAQNYFSHYSPGNPGQAAVFSLLAAYGYTSKISGENIARNNYSDSQSADVAMNAFLASPGHRDNIMDGRYRYIGIGVALGAGGMKYYAVVFAG